MQLLSIYGAYGAVFLSIYGAAYEYIWCSFRVYMVPQDTHSPYFSHAATQVFAGQPGSQKRDGWLDTCNTCKSALVLHVL